MKQEHTLRIYGVPMDLGQNRRGVDMGPSAIRYADLQGRLTQLGWSVTDCGNIEVPVTETVPSDEMIDGFPAHHSSAVISVAHKVYDCMLNCIQSDATAIFLGGDHSISLGTVSGALHRAEDVGVIWVDAHGDYNTPQTSPSGNIHGMVVSSLCGIGPAALTIGDHCLRPDHIVMIGVRDLDREERDALRQSGIKVMTMRDIDERGIADVTREALSLFNGVYAIHVSFDMDSLDPSVAPGVGTPVPGGLSYREAHLLLELLADDGRVRSMDIVEVNPILDNANTTAMEAAALASSLFGQRIL
jgi:arginase